MRRRTQNRGGIRICERGGARPALASKLPWPDSGCAFSEAGALRQGCGARTPRGISSLNSRRRGSVVSSRPPAAVSCCSTWRSGSRRCMARWRRLSGSRASSAPAGALILRAARLAEAAKGVGNRAGEVPLSSGEDFRIQLEEIMPSSTETRQPTIADWVKAFGGYTPAPSTARPPEKRADPRSESLRSAIAKDRPPDAYGR